METVTVGSIITICFLVGLCAKLIPQVTDNAIPTIVGVAGAILGVIGFYVMPDYPANDILSAIAVGIASGLASTGAHQAYKQFKDLFKKED